MGIGAFVGKLFGTEKAVDAMITQTGSALDKLFYTQEEKSESLAADRSEFRKMLIDWMGNTQGQNISRRFIAIVVTITWVMEHVLVWILAAVSNWVSDPAAWTRASEIIDTSSEKTGGAMMLVLGFYFAAPHLGSIVTTAIDKFGGKKNP